MRTFVGVGDDAVVDSLLRLVGSHRQVMCKILQLLAELEERRIHLRRGCSSLFAYCVKALGFSEDEACRRIGAARLGRRFPRIFSMIQEGTVTLSVLALLQEPITQRNAEELLEGVKGLTVKKAKEWLARRFPAPDVPDSVRKLPQPPAAVTSVASSSHPPAAVRPSSEAVSPLIAPVCEAVPPSLQPVVTPGFPRRTVVEPLSAGRFAVKMTVSERVREKLERARDLTRHRNPQGGLEAVLEMALDALLEVVSRKKLGSAQRPRVAAQSAAHPSATGGAKPAHSAATTRMEGAVAPETRTAQARYVPRHARREAVGRDGLQCAYVGTEGSRCEGRAFLEFDHVDPVALGGTSSPGNVRVLCRAHNRLEAENRFGKEHVADAIHRAQSGREAQRRAQKESEASP